MYDVFYVEQISTSVNIIMLFYCQSITSLLVAALVETERLEFILALPVIITSFLSILNEIVVAI